MSESYSDQIYEQMFGHPRPKMGNELTPEERRAALLRAFAIVDSMTQEELNDGFMTERPLNVSILDLPDSFPDWDKDSSSEKNAA